MRWWSKKVVAVVSYAFVIFMGNCVAGSYVQIFFSVWDVERFALMRKKDWSQENKSICLLRAAQFAGGALCNGGYVQSAIPIQSCLHCIDTHCNNLRLRLMKFVCNNSHPHIVMHCKIDWFVPVFFKTRSQKLWADVHKIIKLWKISTNRTNASVILSYIARRICFWNNDVTSCHYVLYVMSVLLLKPELRIGACALHVFVFVCFCGAITPE